MIQPDGRLCLGHVTTWLIAPEQHRNPPDCRGGFLARFALLGPQLKSPRGAMHGATHRALAAGTSRVLHWSCLIGVLLSSYPVTTFYLQQTALIYHFSVYFV